MAELIRSDKARIADEKAWALTQKAMYLEREAAREAQSARPSVAAKALPAKRKNKKPRRKRKPRPEPVTKAAALPVMTEADERERFLAALHAGGYPGAGAFRP